VSLRHLLWRLSEAKQEAFGASVRASCNAPTCDIACVEVRMRVRPHDGKPDFLLCPLCRQPLHVLAAGPAR
jgi:hypothetical protein